MNNLVSKTALSCMALALTLGAWGADVPQFRGPHRDGIFPEKGLLKAWPEAGPALAWKAEGIGKGYSSIAVVKDTIYVPGMAEDNQGYIFAFDLAGQAKWKAAYGPETLEVQAPGARATPTIDGDRLYIISGLGVVYCLSATDGKKLWEVDLNTTFAAAVVDWVFSESPLVDGDRVYATPGGPDASVVALNKMTGETIWTSKGLSEASAYCSPALFTFGGRRVLVTMTADSIVGINETDGKVLWVHAHKTPYKIHGNTPVAAGNLIYYTSGSGAGGGVLEVSADGSSVTQKWLDKQLDSLHKGVVLVDGYIYGTGEKNNKLVCLELATGKVMWEADEITQGNIIYADGMLYVYEGPKKGIVNLVKASPEKYERTGTFAMPRSRDKHWANPAIANGQLFLRYDGVLYAYDITAK